MVKVGIVGVGTVGESVVKTLLKNRDIIKARAGKEIKVVKGVVRDPSKKRGVDIPLTTDYRQVTESEEVDVVVELMGGVEEAYKVVKSALSHGKPVITANKALLAYHRFELQQIAGELPFQYEASVGGGIPIIKALREGLSANHILQMSGILNGTCNYILTAMEQGGDYQSALQRAQELGYAEADPTLDVNGMDTAHKLLILASVAYNIDVRPEDILVEGIEELSPVDFEFAQEMGYKIKLLAIAKKRGENRVELRVHPTLLPKTQLLSKIEGVMNGVSVIGDVVGETLYYGPGAGGDATASAVVSDLIEVVRGSNTPMLGYKKPLEMGDFQLVPQMEIESCYYFRLGVEDKIGTLAKISSILAEEGISIKNLIQKQREGYVKLLLSTHRSKEANIQRALEKLRAQKFMKREPFFLRVEEK
ncbi:MAG: homoserine dehydrogenase [Epsilonproteobacteria bacterium]|jgi:homoserine dehydrogenase|nr:homoserine dehydrogenase [Campylobacterota bacterium]NPA89694.1 homoserine dehydrogenase [Campylobacterota bacterium]